MKYIKKFENEDVTLKKYILILSDDERLSIIEVFEPYINFGGDLMYHFKTLYRIDNNGIRKMEVSNKNDLKLRFNFIIKHMVLQSNKIKDLLDKMELIYNSNKYNL